MATLVTFNSTGYLIPTSGETGWASTVTNFLVDLGTNVSPKTAAAFTAGSVNNVTIGLSTPTGGAFTNLTANTSTILSLTAPTVNIDGGTIDATVIGSAVPAAATLTSLNGDQLAGNRNVIINGSFDIWQRGVSFPSPGTGAYLADRWALGTTGSAGTFVIGELSVNQASLLDLGFAHYLSSQVTVAGSESARNLIQRIEGVRTFSARTVAVTAWMWCDVGGPRTCSFNLAQFFGTGGAPSATVSLTPQTFSVTASPQKFTTTFALASISGKTLGTNGDDTLNLVIGLPLATVSTINVTGVQIEIGVATPFERRPPQVELALCQRYYQLGTVRWTGFQNATNGFGVSQSLPVAMRAVPTATSNFTTTTNCTSPTLTPLDTDTIMAQATATASAAAVLVGTFTVSAEL